ncbi:LysM peptidoglycan-binding domain-containing protein [bacterium]|nr:LysM peptidoglycan-binding domain-containing protein [bacterium]
MKSVSSQTQVTTQRPATGAAPAATAKPTAPQAPLGADKLAKAGKTVEVTVIPGKDHLSVTAKAGDSYWSIARKFASAADGIAPTESEINAYVKDLQALNGKTLKAGQTVKLPINAHATFMLEAMVAAQKAAAVRQKAGEKLPALDWRTAQAAWGYAEAQEISVTPAKGGKPLGFAAIATGSAKGGSVYKVHDLAAYHKQAGL